MHELIWSKSALSQLEAIFDYVAADDPNAADRLTRRIATAVLRLQRFPLSGRQGREPGTRELVVAGTPYIVVYEVTDTVAILTVYHGARRWPVID
jgi:addiction module RelE/StbE family toxin